MALTQPCQYTSAGETTVSVTEATVMILDDSRPGYNSGTTITLTFISPVEVDGQRLGCGYRAR